MRWEKDSDGWWDLSVDDEPVYVLSYTKIANEWVVLYHEGSKTQQRTPVTEITWQKLRKYLELEYLLLRGER